MEYIAALDVGTTTLRCYIVNSQGSVVGKATTKIKLLHPKPHYVEIDPNQLWEATVEIIKQAITIAGLTPHKIKCLGISTQRATFLTWRKSNGKPFHNFITWKDMRSKDIVKEWNKSFTLMSIKGLGYFLQYLPGQKMFRTCASFKFATAHCSGRLFWVLSNNKAVKSAVEENDILFGTVDTWLLYKLSGGKIHVTDVSNASGTGLFDPYANQWGGIIKFLIDIPVQILPKVVPCDYDFGSTEEDIFGVRIPIKCVLADQAASLFGCCCFEPLEAKITLGTGSFVNFNTGTIVEGGVQGTYPMAGWDIRGQRVYHMEAACNDTGSLIEWAMQIGLVDNAEETSSLSSSVPDSDGVYFIPAFSGLGPPFNNERAASGFIGVKPTTRKAHMMRAILESITYRVVLVYELMKKQLNVEEELVRVDGGVSNNDFICQLLADLANVSVQRYASTELTGIGIAKACGLISGLWKDYKELRASCELGTLFRASADKDRIEKEKKEMASWIKAVERFKSWYIDME